jgi:branched-chain amino acid transport system permease protein
VAVDTVKTGKFRAACSRVPLLGWLLGIFAAVMVEKFFGIDLALAVGLPKIPALFGIDIMLKRPLLVPNAFLYTVLIYALPIGVVAVASAPPANRIAAWLIRLPIAVPSAVHLGLLFLSMYYWAEVSDYRSLVLKLTLIAVMLTLSLNVINGYMGEFSCSHPGFMALGAYCASMVTVGLFVDARMFGIALLPEKLGPLLFPVALIAGGLTAAVGALLVAVPSFRTRGDYLAIISLAFLFIVKSLIENFEFLKGPRGMSGQPDWAGLPTVFLWCVLCVWSINNYVRSTLGKALNAVRDNELAAEAMTVNTRHTKMVGFLFAAFWAGVAGGLFAHVLRYVNPGTFGIQNLAEVLAMVYFGGLNSVYGSIVGAVSISLLGEALRPLEIFKWIIIPLLLILVMIYRPTGLIAFKELDPEALLRPKQRPEGKDLDAEPVLRPKQRPEGKA